jgi:hypothetical protein
MRRLWVRHSNVGNSSSNVAEDGIDAAAERLGAYRNGQSDEHYKHGVFDCSGTGIVPKKPIDQGEHLSSPLDWSAAQLPYNLLAMPVNRCSA